MRNIDNRGRGEAKQKRMTSLVALTHRLKRQTAQNTELPAKSKMAPREPQNGLERGSTLDYWTLQSTFDSLIPSMRTLKYPK